MYVVLNVPAAMPRRWALRRRFGRSFSHQQQLCQFALCDENATTKDVGRPLCALHQSLIEEIQYEVPAYPVCELPVHHHSL